MPFQFPELSYPESPRGDVVDAYQGEHGPEVAVPDPYRWLEDPDSPQTRAWVAAQNELTQAVLAELPAREAYLARLTALWDHARPGAPWQRGGRYFRTYNPGLLNQPLLQTADAPGGPWRTLLDPNALSGDGTVALAGMSVSRDGRALAYSVQSGGSDWMTWMVRDVGSGQDAGDVLTWSKFSGAAWLPVGGGFYYSAYDAPRQESPQEEGVEPSGTALSGAALTDANRSQRLMLHRLGTPQEADTVVIARPDEPDWGFHPWVTDDGRYLVVSVWKGTDPRNLLWVRPLDSGGPESDGLESGGAFTELVPDFRAAYQVLGSDGDTLYVQTDEDAPLGRVIAWNVQTGERRPLIPEGPDVLDSAHVVPDGLLTVTMRDASHRLHLYSREGEWQREIALPTYGTVTLHTRQDDPDVFLSFTSFLFPAAPYRLRLPGGELEALEPSTLTFDPGDFQVAQEFAVSRDGTRVPMFIVCRAGTLRGGTNHTLLYGYGGFNIGLTPTFSAARVAWLERGGVYVSANLRGGNEYGEDWHQAGTLGRKQNVFDDFVAVAEHLIARQWTSPAHLGINGGSNGGLLVGAALTQRPELFAAAVPQVGVLDMLRYHLFTIGWAWASDYGRSDDPALFAALHAYSPLHNLHSGTAYPATLITTGDHDDRVVPAHSFKFAAQLQHVQGQHAQTGSAPALIRIQTRAGHGAGKPTALVIEEWADIWAFLEAALGAEVQEAESSTV